MLKGTFIGDSLTEKPVIQKPMTKDAAVFRARFHLLLIFLILGLVVGALLASQFDMNEKKMYIPMAFSGIPVLRSGFIAVFSTLLLNSLMTLIALFLAGITAFGTLAVPVLIFFKGFATGVAAISFLYKEANGLWQSAFTYMPVVAASSILLVFFAVYAFVFSKAFSKTFFAAGSVELPDFTVYLKTFFLFLSFLVLVNFVGSFFTLLYPILFSAGG